MKKWSILKMNDSNLIIYEHQIIEVQFEIDKFMAELEFHKQKSRLITDQLELNNTKLSHLQKIIQRRRKLNKFRSKKHD
jgi:hypothetical protein